MPLPCCLPAPVRAALGAAKGAMVNVILRELRETWTRRGAVGWLAIFILLVGAFLFQSLQYWHAVIDDSYITFRFVDMFAKGHGWRFNPDGPRVEGFTNFLWAVLLLPPHLFGWDLMFVSKLMGLGSGVVAMFGAWRLARWVRDRDDMLNLLAPALMAVNAHFAHWAMMGLETLMQVAFVVCAYWLFVKEMRDSRQLPISAVCALLAALTRFDSLYYLSPLGLYGIWALVRGYASWRQALRWALIAGLPFLVYTGWKAAYFGSLLPNTYWAKQRHVLFEGRDRGHEQLARYYFAQTDDQRSDPPVWGTEDATRSIVGQRVARAVHVALAGSLDSIAWMNVWLIGLLGCGLWIVLAGGPGCRAATLLILMPWGLNVFYVHHVNGDWMPGFRFFQIALPFVAVAFVVGLARIPQIAGIRRSFGAPVVLGAWLLASTAWEQLQINTIYIFGRDSFIYIGREPGWWTPRGVSGLWNRGFAPPLREVSEKLLTATQDGAHIFMSDIGQPMWFSEHLNLYDVDGLVDPRLAHAPQTRGEVPTIEEFESRAIAALGRQPEGRELKELEINARKDEFRARVEDNARWIMEEARPEYLLIFVNHQTPDPRSPGGAYPWVSNAVYTHASMVEYEELWTALKVGNAYNHLYRRRDVDAEVPPRKRLERILRVVERNPRMPAVGVMLLRESLLVRDLTPEEREKIDQIVRGYASRFPADPAVLEIGSWASLNGRDELAIHVLLQTARMTPSQSGSWRTAASIQLRVGKRSEAIATLREGIGHVDPSNPELHFMLASARAGGATGGGCGDPRRGTGSSRAGRAGMVRSGDHVPTRRLQHGTAARGAVALAQSITGRVSGVSADSGNERRPADGADSAG